MVSVTAELEVEVDLAKIESHELLEELRSRDIDFYEDISEFDDGDIKDEFLSRFNDPDTPLTSIYNNIIAGNKESAIAEMHDWLRDKLGKTL